MPNPNNPTHRTREEREAAGGSAYLGRQDWSLFIRETTDETIDRVFGEISRTSEATVPEIRAAVHEIIAVELERQAHRFKSRTSLLAPNNVAYHLTARAEEIRKENPL